jgi:WD40 repeat protein
VSVLFALTATRHARKALDAERHAVRQRDEAARQARRAERTLNANRVVLAQHAWEDGDVELAFRNLKLCPEDARAWEWHYLHRLCRGEERRLGIVGSYLEVGPRFCSKVLTFDRRGARLCLTPHRDDGDVVVWDTATGQCVRALDTTGGGKKGANEMMVGAAHPDGDVVAVGKSLGRITVWRVATGERLRQFTAGPQAVTALGFSADGRRLAAATPASVDVWDWQAGQSLVSLPGAGVFCGFSPDGQYLLTGTPGPAGPQAILWETATWREARRLGSAQKWSFSRDGRTVVLGGEDGPRRPVLRVLDTATGEELTRMAPAERVVDLSLNADGRHLAVTTGGTAIDIWDVPSGRLLRTLKGHTSFVPTVEFTPDGRRLVSLGDAICFWDFTRDQVAHRPPEEKPEPLRSGAFSPDATRAVCACDYKAKGIGVTLGMTVRDVATGRALATHLSNHAAPAVVAFAASGKRFISGGDDGLAVVWDAATGNPLTTLRGERDQGPVWNVALSPDGRWAASVQRSKRGAGQGGVNFGLKVPTEITIWNAETGQPRQALLGQDREFDDLLFSPDGDVLVTAGASSVRFWDLKRGEVVKEWPVGGSYTPRLCFNHDGTRLACLFGDRVQVYAVAEDRPLYTVFGRGWRAAFSRDGKRLAMAEGARGVKLLDAETGQVVLNLRPLPPPDAAPPPGPIRDLAFSADGHRLFALFDNGTIQSWDATPVPAPAVAADVAGTDPTRRGRDGNP